MKTLTTALLLVLAPAALAQTAPAERERTPAAAPTITVWETKQLTVNKGTLDALEECTGVSGVDAKTGGSFIKDWTVLDNNRDGKVDSAETSWLTLGKKKLQASDIACVGVLVEQRSVSK